MEKPGAWERARARRLRRQERTIQVLITVRPFWVKAKYHVQFCLPPHGYFRGHGRSPGQALRAAWRRARAELPRPDLATIE